MVQLPVMSRSTFRLARWHLSASLTFRSPPLPVSTPRSVLHSSTMLSSKPSSACDGFWNGRSSWPPKAPSSQFLSHVRPSRASSKKRLAPSLCQSQQFPPPSRLRRYACPHIPQNFAVLSSSKASHSDHAELDADSTVVRAAAVAAAAAAAVLRACSSSSCCCACCCACAAAAAAARAVSVVIAAAAAALALAAPSFGVTKDR
eukprot:scaffold90541_cov63-Phaeocystis_antarctica.AAC.3